MIFRTLQHTRWNRREAAEMRGLASDEIAPWELNAKDDTFPVEVGAYAVKHHIASQTT